MIDPATCRAARGLLDWTQEQLAVAAGVSVRAVATYERGRTEMRPSGLAAIKRALADAGVEILDRDGAPVGVQRR